MREIDGTRKKASKYELAVHLTACLAMFLFKTESRNNYNTLKDDLRLQQNYEKLFKLLMPHVDSIHHVINGVRITSKHPTQSIAYSLRSLYFSASYSSP
jgi:hypothetical protein